MRLATCCTGRDSIQGSRCCRGFFLMHLPAAADSVPFCIHHRLGPVTCFAQVVLTFICWLTRSGVILDQRKDNSLHPCVPSPGLKLASAPLILVKHHTHRKVACLCPQRPDKGGGGSPGLLLVRVNIIEHNADANPQFRQGSMEHSPRTSRLS